MKLKYLLGILIVLQLIVGIVVLQANEVSGKKIEDEQRIAIAKATIKGKDNVKYDLSLQEKIERNRPITVPQSKLTHYGVEALLYIKPAYVENKNQSFNLIIKNIGKELENNGIQVVDTRTNPLTVKLNSISDLEVLNNTDFVSYIRDKEPLNLKPEPVTSEGVSKIGAKKCWDKGYSGQGVNVGVLDLGFEGWKNLKSQGELPQDTYLYSGNGVGSGDHGSACAEIVHDVAPGSGIYLASIDSVSVINSYNAIKWFKNNSVDVISHAVSYYGWGPSYLDSNNDGNAEFWDVYKLVEYAIENNITWVNAAGNYGDKHWEGYWQDNDNDGYLDIYKDGTYKGVEYDREGIQLKLRGGEEFEAWVRWDDYNYPSNPPTNDFDIELQCWNGSSWMEKADSQKPQNGDFGQEPLENISYTPSFNGERNCSLIIEKYDAPNASSMHFDIWWQGDSGIWKHDDKSYDPIIESGSIAPPADHPKVIAVGAVPYDNLTNLREYSSLGPAYNPYLRVYNLTKPDLVAPDGVSTYTYNHFHGTSASAPHVAGAATLLLSADSTLNPSEVKQTLEDTANGLGDSGKDNRYGSGLVNASRAVSSVSIALPYVKLVTGTTAVTPGTQFDMSIYIKGDTTKTALINFTFDPAKVSVVSTNTYGVFGFTDYATNDSSYAKYVGIATSPVDIATETKVVTFTFEVNDSLSDGESTNFSVQTANINGSSASVEITNVIVVAEPWEQYDNNPPYGVIDDAELVTAISDWIGGGLNDRALVSVIQKWL